MQNDKNLMSVAKQNRTALTFEKAFSTLLPVKAIKNQSDAMLIYKNAERIGDKALYKACKALWIVRERKLFKESAESFNGWAESNGISKSAANARAKVAKWIDEDGQDDIFAELRGGKSFGYGILLLLFEKTKGNEDTVRELINAGRLPIGITAEDVRKLFKLDPANEIKIDGEKTSEKPADSEQTNGEKTTDSKKTEKTVTMTFSLTPTIWNAISAAIKKSEDMSARTLADIILNNLKK